MKWKPTSFHKKTWRMIVSGHMLLKLRIYIKLTIIPRLVEMVDNSVILSLKGNLTAFRSLQHIGNLRPDACEWYMVCNLFMTRPPCLVSSRISNDQANSINNALLLLIDIWRRFCMSLFIRKIYATPISYKSTYGISVICKVTKVWIYSVDLSFLNWRNRRSTCYCCD